MPDRSGIYALDRKKRLELAMALLERTNDRDVAEAAFRRAYPTAPDSMIQAAVHHVFVDGPDAVAGWLADVELFLRDPNHRLCCGVASEILYHLYNWHQLESLMPAGKPGMLELLDDIKLFAEEGSIDAVKRTVDDLKNMLNGTENNPEFSV